MSTHSTESSIRSGGDDIEPILCVIEPQELKVVGTFLAWVESQPLVVGIKGCGGHNELQERWDTGGRQGVGRREERQCSIIGLPTDPNKRFLGAAS